MNGLSWAILVVTAGFAVADWYSRATENRTIELICKPLATIGLLGVALTLDPADDAVRLWFVVALVFSLIGDVLLMFSGDDSPSAEPRVELWFVFGLASFLVGHVAYIVGLVTAGIEGADFVVGLAIVIAAMAVVGRRILVGVRSSTEPGLLVPVTAYMTVISIMVACAIGTGEPLAIAGAAFFYASDALIGWGRFVKSYSWGSVAIMVTYHVAQACLVLSLVHLG